MTFYMKIAWIRLSHFIYLSAPDYNTDQNEKLLEKF